MNNREIQIIQNKILAKDEFSKLNSELNRFNVFSATNMEKQEIKHTKFLGFLLDPNESHSINDIFLRNFISRIAEKLNNFPSILDLDFSFSRIRTEVELFKGENGRIDLILELPYRKERKDSLGIIIAIENKINVTQSKNQLKKYSEGLERHYPGYSIYKLFLSLDSEEPIDDSWVAIMYANTIFPSVRFTINSINKIGSSHLIFTLENYLQLLDIEEVRDEHEVLARNLLSDPEIQNYIDKFREEFNKNSLFKEINIKYKNAVNYLSKINMDPRVPILKWWQNEIKEFKTSVMVGNSHHELIFIPESSSLKYFRFSILSKENRDFLKNISKNSEKKWLQSGCPLSFEIIFDKDNNASFKIVLVLGPLDSDEVRFELLNKIYEPLQKDIRKRPFTKKVPNLYWNRLISNGSSEYSELSLSDVKDFKNWVDTNIISFADNNSPSSLSIKKISTTLNQILCEFIRSSPQIL